MADQVGILSVILQGGSFALIAYLVIWGWPQMRKEGAVEHAVERAAFIAALTESASERKEDRKEFGIALSLLIGTFKSETAAERDACERHFATLAETMRVLASSPQEHSAVGSIVTLQETPKKS